jgi:hypothetical protein
VDSDRLVLGIPRITRTPLRLHSDWTGTGTVALQTLGWWISPIGVLVESECPIGIRLESTRKGGGV